MEYTPADATGLAAVVTSARLRKGLRAPMTDFMPSEHYSRAYRLHVLAVTHL
jgi:hypothetical protein